MKGNKESLEWHGHNKKGIPEFRAEFQSAKSSDEKLKVFRKIEARLEEKHMAYDCWIMAKHYYEQGQDQENIISFGKRALNIILRDETNDALGTHRSSMVIGSVLHLLGSACFELKRYNESLSYLNWSDRNLSKLLEDNYCANFVLKNLHNTHSELAKVKKVAGRGDEVVFHLKKVLEFDEKIYEKGCLDIGLSNMNVSDAYLGVGNFEDALPFALQALEICEKHLVDDSRELTMLRLSLGAIYSELGEFEKAYEQYQLSLNGLKSMGNTFRLLMADVEGSQMLIRLGRYEEAIGAMKLVISQAETVVDQRDATDVAKYKAVKSVAFMAMAKAFCRQEKYFDARKYIKIAVRMLEKQRIDPGIIANGFVDMAQLYQDMKEYEAAISLVQKALSIPELPQDSFADCTIRLFLLVSLSRTEERRLSSLEEVVERLKEKCGSEHWHVGYTYANLGDVYLSLGRPETAAEVYLRAKDILQASLGPHHLYSLTVDQALSVAYASMKSYDLAIENQEKVVIALKGLGLTEQDGANNNAVQLLNMIKQRDIGQIAESHARASQQSEDGKDLFAANSECGVSDDGKVN